MFKALYPHPEDRLHLRLHRARSVILTTEELVEIRAAQRTFEGAYMRTALSQFSFALVVLKIFTSEFYAIGALYAVYGTAVMLLSIYRRYEGNRQFFVTEEEEEEAKHEHDEHCHRQQSCWYEDEEGAEGARPELNRRLTTPVIVTKKKFRTSGNSVALLSLLSLSAYVVLIVLIYQLQA